MPPVAEVQEVKAQEVSKEPVKLPMRNWATIQLQRPTRNLRRYIELMDQKDNLWKMERELKRIIDPRPQNTARQPAVKKLTDLPPVNICYIGAVGFYWNLVQPNTVAFITSLYKINWLIEEKEALA